MPLMGSLYIGNSGLQTSQNALNTTAHNMTNADTATMAAEGLIKNPMNPFTGNVINNEAKEDGVYIIASQEFDVQSHGDYTFNASKWAKVKDNLWEKNNWTFSDAYTLLPPDMMP